MAYSVGAIETLTSLIPRVRDGFGILDLGAQDIKREVPRSTLLSCLKAIHGNSSKAEAALARLDTNAQLRVSDLFRGSLHRYRCIDLFPGEFTIIADMNVAWVGEEDTGKFDLILNFGTTEHVFDQANCFRMIHDYAAVGATIFHSVPCSGYLNHGLFKYHPLFFVLLSHANAYEIEVLRLTPPHSPYTMPEDLLGDDWAGITNHCGIVNCQLRKVAAAPFAMFTDFDQTIMGKSKIDSPWAELSDLRFGADWTDYEQYKIERQKHKLMERQKLERDLAARISAVYEREQRASLLEQQFEERKRAIEDWERIEDRRRAVYNREQKAARAEEDIERRKIAVYQREQQVAAIEQKVGRRGHERLPTWLIALKRRLFGVST